MVFMIQGIDKRLITFCSICNTEFVAVVQKCLFCSLNVMVEEKIDKLGGNDKGLEIPVCKALSF